MIGYALRLADNVGLSKDFGPNVAAYWARWLQRQRDGFKRAKTRNGKAGAEQNVAPRVRGVLHVIPLVLRRTARNFSYPPMCYCTSKSADARSGMTRFVNATLPISAMVAPGPGKRAARRNRHGRQKPATIRPRSRRNGCFMLGCSGAGASAAGRASRLRRDTAIFGSPPLTVARKCRRVGGDGANLGTPSPATIARRFCRCHRAGRHSLWGSAAEGVNRGSATSSRIASVPPTTFSG